MKVIENGKVREMTAEEIEQYEKDVKLTTDMQIEELKQNLADTDYKAIRDGERAIMKILEILAEKGFDVDKSHLENYHQRENWRDEINRLEKENE